MKHSRSKHIAVIAVTLTVGFSLHAESLRYEVKMDLGVGIYAVKLNNLDQILGERQGTPGIWSPGTGFAALPAPVGAASGFGAVDFNDKGEVIGSNPNGGLFWPSLKTAPTTIVQGIPVAINAKSHIALSPGPLYQSSIWSNGKTIVLPNYKAHLLFPTDINDLDTVITIEPSSQLPVLVSQGVAHEISNLPTFFVAESLNTPLYLSNTGAVAGDSWLYTNSQQISRAFLWTPQAGTTDLGTPANQSSFVVGLDDHNRVLGYLDRDGGTPFVWQPGIGMTELTSLIDLSDQYVRMQSVANINSQGEILGSLLDRNGRSHIVVLTPVPEPAIWLIGALSMLCLLFKCRRARIPALLA